MELKSMKRTPGEGEVMGEGERPEYPMGLSMRLGDEELEKLGVSAMPEVGDSMMAMARVEVRSAEQSDIDGEGVERSVMLQVTDMAIQPGQRTDAAQQIYGGGEPA